MPFEDELGEALRRTGDGFTTDGLDLVAAGERRGRRLVARRRAAVVGGSALALAVIGTAGAYTGGLFGAGGSGGPVNVAEAPTPSPPASPSSGEDPDQGSKPRTGSGAVSAEQLIGVFKQLLPGGTVTGAQARGTGEGPGPMVSGIFDDGKGGAAIGVGLSRVDPQGQSSAEMVTCPSKIQLSFDSCTVEKLADGSRLLLFQGYEYPDRRVDTKNWRATLLTPQGYLVDVQEHNAPAEKGAATNRSTPPLTPAQLKAFTTSPLWLPALKDLPAARTETPPVAKGPAPEDVLDAMLRDSKTKVLSKEPGGSDLSYAVIDDGKGQALVSLQIQPDSQKHPGMWAELFTSAETLPDGTKILSRKRNGETAGAVVWQAEVLRTNGTRVIVSAFNTKVVSGAPTRKEPPLSIEQLRDMATGVKWSGFGY
ncbi:hypothetical protein [Streptomyces sp. NBC_00503]|uniref:hypothetical protein n=1 Tax=Streptomyces sp. NBC_00503 TaxID=2903659 RepID=UPI002E80E51A|nr:hypothetical protein [Streptomyces sp. NBC_00503]WUD82812.1 hypothetical protein OG490_20925 [Streptomyces sp. NBC_00503]